MKITVDTQARLPVSILPLTDDGDFKSRKTSIAFDEPGMELYWNFQSPGIPTERTQVAPVSGGNDIGWNNEGRGEYTVTIQATGGAAINNDTEGSGWFSGICDGVLPWRSPTFEFLPVKIIDSLLLGTDNLEIDVIQIHGSALTETSSGYLAAAFTTLFDVASPLLVASDVMRGNDTTPNTVTPNTVTPPTLTQMTAAFTEIKGATWSATDTLEAIRNALDASARAANESTAGNITTGTDTANSYTDTATSNGVAWQVAGEPEVGGFGINMDLTFALGADKKADIVNVRAKEDQIGVVHVWAWNYQTTVWDQISDTGNAISGAAYNDFGPYVLLASHQKVSDGEVKLRFTAAGTADNKYLWLDMVHVLTGGTGTLTAADIAEAVAVHDVSAHTDHKSFGFRASLSLIDEYAITASNSTTSFTCSSLPATTNFYQYQAVRIHDTDNDLLADSWILSMDNAGVVTLGRALPFTPQVDHELYVMDVRISPTENQLGLATSTELATHDDKLVTIGIVVANTFSVAEVLDANIEEVKSVTDAQGGTGSGLNAIPWNADWDEEVQSECNDALVALFLDRLFAVDYDPSSKPGVATALLNELIENNAGVSRYTEAALAQAPSGSGGDATEANQDAMIATLATVALTGADSDTLETLSDQLDALAALSGGGAFTGTLTIDDGATGLQGVVVNARLGGVLQATGTTDVNGQITDWAFDANTFDLASQISGYQPSTDTLTVAANAWTKTVSLTLIAITAPPNASTTTGVGTTYDEEQVLEEGVSVNVQILDGPGTDGIAYDSAVWTELSNVSGVVQFAGIVHGARYKIWRGDSKPKAVEFTAPTTGTSFDLPEVIGRG